MLVFGGVNVFAEFIGGFKKCLRQSFIRMCHKNLYTFIDLIISQNPLAHQKRV